MDISQPGGVAIIMKISLIFEELRGVIRGFFIAVHWRVKDTCCSFGNCTFESATVTLACLVAFFSAVDPVLLVKVQNLHGETINK